MTQDEIRIGALLRAYSPKPEGVDNLLQNLLVAVVRLHNAGINNVQIGVWADKDNPAADCGLTYNALCERMARSTVFRNTRAHESTNGDLFVTVLNDGLAFQHIYGLSHSLILSWEAASYVDLDLIGKMKQAVCDGALAVGVALPEIAEFVCQGAIMNTLALWNLNELYSIGGFDKLDTKPRYAYHYAESNAGVGEFIPLLKLAEKHQRPVYAVVKPTQQGTIEVPSERKELQRKKLESKQRRINGMLKEIGKTPENLKLTLMPYII